MQDDKLRVSAPFKWDCETECYFAFFFKPVSWGTWSFEPIQRPPWLPWDSQYRLPCVWWLCWKNLCNPLGQVSCTKVISSCPVSPRLALFGLLGEPRFAGTDPAASSAAEGRSLRFLANVDPIDVKRALQLRWTDVKIPRVEMLWIQGGRILNAIESLCDLSSSHIISIKTCGWPGKFPKNGLAWFGAWLAQAFPGWEDLSCSPSLSCCAF